MFNIVRGDVLLEGTFHFGFWVGTKEAVVATYFHDPAGDVFELFYEDLGI